jgi:two-component system, cell cycle sensor histidine kinase and response regulator CckA
MGEKPAYDDLMKKVKDLEQKIAESKTVEEDLRRSEEKYRSILENIEDEYYEIDLEGKYTFVNQAVCKNQGLAREELIGTNSQNHLTPEEGKRLYKILREIYRTGIPANLINYEVIRKDGQLMYFEDSISLLKDVNGNPIGFSGIARNITERKKNEDDLARSEQEYRNILEFSPDLIVIASIDEGRLKMVNQAFCKLSGYREDEVLGRTPDDLNLFARPEDQKRLDKALGETGRAYGVEIQYRTKDGTINDFLFSAGIVQYQGEYCLLFVGSVITTLKEAQKALRESEEKYRHILEQMEEGYYEIDLSGNFTFFNDAERRIHGRSAEEMLGLNNRLFSSPQTAKKIFKIYNEVYKTGIPAKVIDYEIITKDGSIKVLETSASLLRNAVGEPIGFYGVSRDVTERKKAEQALRESEEKYRNILNNMEEVYYEVDLAGNLTFFNPAMCKSFGRTPDELMGMNYREYTSPEGANLLFSVFNEVFRTGIPNQLFDFPIIRIDGAVRMLEGSVSLLRNPDGEPIGFRGMIRDRTLQNNAEIALQQSEEKYRNILENMEEGYYEVDLAGNRTFLNKAHSKIYGYSLEEMMGMNNRVYMTPETAKKIFNIFNEVYRSGGSAQIVNYEVIKKDGTVALLESSVSLLKDSEGKPIGFHGMVRDKTEKQRAERALRESEEKYRLLVENANDGICIIQDGKFKFVNLRTERLTGYSAEELGGIYFENLVHPKDREVVIEWGSHILMGGGKPGPKSFRMVTKEEETIWVEANTIDILWEGNPATLNFVRDITPQKKMEAQFLQAQKMEAVGTLAGGMAHDFNNLLMGIQGNTSLILLDIDSDHPHYSKLKAIEQQVQAGAELTRQLLGAARGGKYEARATDINPLIERGLDMFSRTRKELQIHKYFSEAVWTVDVDRSQIEQVLLNLYVNAGHAMPGGGDLYVETKNILLDETYTKSYGLAPGKYVRISVTDTGVGMDETTQKRAFDPFFTTRDMGRGTGLGLASAYGIIRNHNGIINIYSEKGEGTTFNIYLPVTEKKIADQPEIPEEIFLGTESVLFVDDEEAISQIGRRLLERLGYRVIPAGSGQEALDIYQREGAGIDLVILDMIMPGMNGGETFDRLKIINPGVIVLLSSGYSINGQAKTILDRGCRGFLQKPFSLVDLSKKVRQVLDERNH